MTLSIWNHRSPVTGPWAKKQGETLTLGFIGGSITDGRPRHNWPEPVTAWFVEQLPGVRIAVENAGIGATGSDLAALRAERDLINRGAELVFVEFAVNDYDEPVEKRGRTLEGLLRKLLADPKRQVVLVYTYSQPMYEYMMADEKPPIIAQYEAIAEYYGLGSVWMGLHALDEVKRGHMRWEEWLPDGLHPTNRGSFSYGTSVIRFLNAERERSLTVESASWVERRQTAMETPLDPRNWQSARLLDLTEVKTTGPWVLRRLNGIPWIDRTLETAAVGAELSFSFHGRGVALGFDFGKASAEFRYRIDGGEWQTESRERQDWVGLDGWFRLSNLVLDLEIGDHSCEIEVIHGNGPNCQGTNFRLGLIGILP
ncbi:SGNH/GDSL hydrolase family protein [Gorillibacterium timonense]|uniref:SGNH/GDSL hydrolase family protein n=1 Tax=Gorillibacterium timonense TaxID=1689269 RepID=UPI00071CC60A|nr:SGNH/GDSL hydrolase family protein [Gorillibacterium timonense]